MVVAVVRTEILLLSPFEMNPKEIHVDEKPVEMRPYAQRQYIVVVPDKIVEAERDAQREEAKAKQSGPGTQWQNVAITTLKILSVVSPITVFPGGLVTETTIALVKALARLRETGIHVLAVGQTEAAKLKFSPGHPRQDVLYIGHPAQSAIYYTTALFHRLTFEHKFAEAVQLLMALGASELKVEHQIGWSSEFSAHLSTSVPQTPADLNAQVASSGEAKTQMLFKADLNPTSPAELPGNLVWFHHEPTWQQISEGRLKYGLKNFTLMLRYEDDFGVNAGLKLNASKSGLDLGGKFEDHQATVWKIEGKFSTKPP